MRIDRVKFITEMARADIVPQEEVVELARFIGALIHVAGESHADLLPHIVNGLPLADVVGTGILIGVRLALAVLRQNGNGIVPEGKGSCAVDIPAVEGHSAPLAYRFDCSLSVQL